VSEKIMQNAAFTWESLAVIMESTKHIKWEEEG
jgi:hypothetical protein